MATVTWKYRTNLQSWSSFYSVPSGPTTSNWATGTEWVEYICKATGLAENEYATFYNTGEDLSSQYNTNIFENNDQEYSSGQLVIESPQVNRTVHRYAVISQGELICPEGSHKVNGECVENCHGDSDCPDGQKCIDGECVDCDPAQASHFQIRWEFEELHQDQDGNKVMFVLSDIISIYSLQGNDIVTSPPYVGGAKPWAYPRIRFCDENGFAAPYSGYVSIAGYCNPDGTGAMYVKSWQASGVETPISWHLGDYSQADLISDNPLAVSRVLLEEVEASEVILETKCSGVGSSEPPEVPIVEPEPPVDPVEPDDPEGTDPEILIIEPSEPLEPEAGCECEIYLAKKITKAIIQLSNSVITFGNKVDARFEEQVKIFKQTAEYLKDTFQPIFEKLQEDVSDIEKYQMEISEDIESIKLILEDFVQEYEPVTIENEYRTQSHRVIDNLDSTIADL